MQDTEINEVILFQIEQASKQAKKFSQQILDEMQLGITIDQWVLLKIIEEAHELSQKELADRSLRDPASITRTLNLLEKKGLIRRRNIEGNKRQYCIVLTEEGKQFVEKLLPLVLNLRAQSIQGFSSEELQQLSSMLERIRKNMM